MYLFIKHSWKPVIQACGIYSGEIPVEHTVLPFCSQFLSEHIRLQECETLPAETDWPNTLKEIHRVHEIILTYRKKG